MFPSVFRITAFALALITLAGCGRSDVVAVSGTLTYKGKPVTNAFINFVPEVGRPSIGETDQNGKFTLTYDPETKGAKIGKHRVFVTHNPTAALSGPNLIPGQTTQLSVDETELFNKYSGENSTVTVTIENAISDLKLSWD